MRDLLTLCPCLQKRRLYIPLCVGIFVGGLLATLSCILWLTFGHESLDHTSKSWTHTADATRFQSEQSGSKVFDLLDFNDSVSNFELTASLYSLLVMKGENDLLRLLNQSASIESETKRQAVHSIVFERLADIDPDMALKHALDLRGQRRIQSLETVFQEWALSDLDGAIAAGTRLAHPYANVALRRILRTRSDFSEKMRREIELRIGDENFIQRVIAEERSWLYTQKPEETWNAAVGDGTQLTQKFGLLASVAEFWWRQDSEGVLEKIVESTAPGSDHWTSEKYVVLRLLVQGLAEHSPQEVFDQVANLTAPCKEVLLHAVAEHWSRFDPHAAFLAASAYELDDRRKTFSRVVAQAWARSNPHELIDITSSFSKPLQVVAMEEAILSLGRTNRGAAIKLLRDAQNKGFDATNTWNRFFTDWTKEDSRVAIQWILSNQEMDEHERKGILKVIVRNLDQIDSRRALDWAIFDRSEGAWERIEVELVRTLAHTDIEAAISLLPNIRQESKPASISAVGGVLLDDDRPLRALGLGDLLAETQRSDYFSGVLHHWARHDPKHLMESISSLATNELKTFAARALTQKHERNPVLSDRELEYVKKFLEEK